MKRAIAATIAAALSLVPAVASADRDQLIEDVTRKAAMLRSLRGKVGVNERWSTVTRGEENIKKCLKSVKLALDGGIKAKTEVELTRAYVNNQMPVSRTEGRGRNQKSYSTLAKMRSYCKGKRIDVQLRRTYFALVETRQQIQRIEDGPGNVTRLKYAERHHRSCEREVARAVKLGADKSAQFSRPDVTLGEAKAKMCDELKKHLDSGKKILAKKHASDLAPFHKSLKGDKLKVFQDAFLYGATVFSNKKYPLKDPEDFEYKSVWYEVLEDTGDLGGVVWLVRGYRFDDDNKLIETTKRQFDDEPPKDRVRIVRTAGYALARWMSFFTPSTTTTRSSSG